MSLYRILVIIAKDVRDAGRDGRIVLLLLFPIGLALLYNVTIDDGETLPRTEVAVVEQGTGVADALRAVAGRSAELDLRRAADAREAERLVADDEVDAAVVVAPAQAGGPAHAEVLLGPDAGGTAQAVVAVVPLALTRAAGREPAAETRIRTVATTDQKPYQVIDAKTITMLLTLVTLIAFVAMMVVPIQVAEELETGTFGALRLASTGTEVLAAKALTGLVLAAVGVAITVVLTRLEVADPLLFGGAALALAVSLVGFGLLMGLLLPNSNAINSYAAFLLMPLIGLAAAVFFVGAGTFATILDLLPFGQAAKLLANGLAEERPFDTGPVSWLVIAVWAVLGYAALARIATRREL